MHFLRRKGIRCTTSRNFCRFRSKQWSQSLLIFKFRTSGKAPLHISGIAVLWHGYSLPFAIFCCSNLYERSFSKSGYATCLIVGSEAFVQLWSTNVSTLQFNVVDFGRYTKDKWLKVLSFYLCEELWSNRLLSITSTPTFMTTAV